MFVYLTVLIIVTLSANIALRSNSKIVSRLFLGLGFVSMVLVAGLRHRLVGTDSGNYVRIFNSIQEFTDILAPAGRSLEYGFWTLAWLPHFISDQYMVYFLFIALIVIGCYQSTILKYSEHLGISYFVFITMGFYTFFFNGARQGMACAVYALAISPLFDRNFKKYFFIVLLATLFHKSALITLPVYFIFNKANTMKTNALIVFIGCAGAYFLQSIVEIASRFDSRYSTYADSGVGGGYLIVTFICSLCLFFLFYKKSVHVCQEQYGLFLNLFVFGAVISLVPTLFGVNPSGLLRLNLYFNISAIFLWPIVFKNLKTRSTKILFSYMFIALYVVYFVLTTQRFSNLTPYMFNSSVPFS